MSGTESGSSPQPRAGLIKDELLTLSSLVLFAGIISTEAYYDSFSVRYRLLGLPSSHVVYRGLTILIDAPYLLVPYLLAAIRLCSLIASQDGRFTYWFLRPSMLDPSISPCQITRRCRRCAVS